MVQNKLCPQNYVNMVVDFVNYKSSGFTADMIVKYCIKKTEHLDDGDEGRIEKLVDNTLNELEQNGYISSRGNWYKTRKQVTFADCFIVVEDRVPPMRITKERVRKLNEIDLYGRILTEEDEEQSGI